MITKVTKVEIKKECRELHGQDGAIDEAIRFIKDKYNWILDADCNKDSTIRIEIYIDRDTLS